MSLEEFGWDADWQASWTAAPRDGLEPARVVAEHRDACIVQTAAGTRRAEWSGRLRHALAGGEGLHPTAGDWVAVETRPGGGATLHDVLPRRTRIARQDVGKRTAEHVLAANVDVLFVMTGLDADFNLRRVERALTLVGECGAEPVVLLTKADVCDRLEEQLAAARAAAGAVPVFAISAVANHGLEPVREALGRGRTGALLGSSGVGKSTLANALLGTTQQAVREVRAADGRGKHTTVTRQLLQLPGGGLLLDTPGLRLLRLWDGEEALDRVFDEFDPVAAGCRFADCRHESEPGCAVQAALATGALDPERLASRRKLGRELEHLAAKRDASQRAARNREVRRLHRAYNALQKQRGNRERRGS
jgi:ribosome biogenesis GTPase